MSERYGCMFGHSPDVHRPSEGCAECDCDRYVEYDHSDDHYSGPRGGEAEAEQRHSQDSIQRELKR